MKLVLQPATAADIDVARGTYGPDKGDLAAAASGLGWPVDPDDLEGLKRRLDWSCDQQRDIIENDPTTRMVKVVDTNNDNDIIAFGRWHRYPHGYQHMGDLEISGLKDRNNPHTWPEGVNRELYIHVIETSCIQRREWMGTGHYWVLTNIVTRAPFRGHGAGSLIIDWGLQQAAQEGVPAYLASARSAKALYEKHGFREVGVFEMDCTPLGVPDFKFTLSRMRADP